MSSLSSLSSLSSAPTFPLSTLVSPDASYVSRRVFTDREVYEREKTHIFGRNWLYVAHESEIKKKGDFVTTYMGETPVIVIRGDKDVIHVSINSCAHRGLPVCRAERGSASRFVCPYHAWAYGIDGRLLAVPQQKLVNTHLDKSRLGLKPVPRVESYAGLIFASLNPDIVPLADYLGNMRFYLDDFFERFPGGVEVMGPPQKWRLKANWKLPVENQLGDVGHGPFLHNLMVEGSSALDEIDKYGFNMVPEPGHGAAVRLFPEEAPPEAIMWGSEGGSAQMFTKETQQYLADVQAQVKERLGPVHARLKGFTYGIYPNFSFLWANSVIRVSHPRAPGLVDYWSWWVVPKEAPQSIRKELQSIYMTSFGPGGLFEEDDSEAWTQQYVGSAIDYMEDRPYFYGLGSGEEKPHPLLPGMAGTAFNEHYARNFYQRWQADISAGGPL